MCTLKVASYSAPPCRVDSWPFHRPPNQQHRRIRTMNRRTLLRAAALAPLAAIGPAFGQVGVPEPLLRIVVPFVPGSFTDVSARLLANELTEQLGQPVVIENRGGAGGTAGTVAGVRAAPGGYTP